MITKVVIDEDCRIGQLVLKSFDSGIDRKCIVGRNEIGVQNMHRQIAGIMGSGAVTPGIATPRAAASR